jgi:hypothetical protein
VHEVALHRQLREALARGKVLPKHVRARIIAALDAAETERSLDRGFGLSPTWWRADALRKRDQLIEEAYRRFFEGPDRPISQAAIKIVGIARTLQSGRLRTVTPNAAEGVIKAAIEAGAGFPTTGRQIENLLRSKS